MTLFAVFLGFMLQVAHAWVEPTQTPPNGNVPPPLNISNIAQEKIGGLILNTGGAVNGLIIDKGNVGIGVSSPTISTRLEVAQNNAIKIGNAYLSSGGDYAHLANNEWFNGAAWKSTAPGALIQLTGQSIAFHKHDAVGNHTLLASIDSDGNISASSAWLGGTHLAGGYIRGGTYGFGGIYTLMTNGVCRYANPYTGGCSCPAGFGDYTFHDFISPGTGLYGGVGVWERQCIK